MSNGQGILEWIFFSPRNSPCFLCFPSYSPHFPRLRPLFHPLDSLLLILSSLIPLTLPHTDPTLIP